MELDFSLLTFSPSNVKKNLKLSNRPNNKKSAKLALKHRRLDSVEDNKDKFTLQEVRASSPNELKSMQKNIIEDDFVGSDAYGVLCNKFNKSRISKGKENRGDASCISNIRPVITNLQGESYSKNPHKSCRPSNYEHGSSRKKRSIDQVSDTSYNTSIPKKKPIATSGGLTECSSFQTGDCARRIPLSPVLVADSDCSLVERSDGSINASGIRDGEVHKIIVLSDSSSVSSDSGSNLVSRDTKSSRRRIHPGSRPIRKVGTTIVLETSDSETDVLEASCEVPVRLNMDFNSPMNTELKSSTGRPTISTNIEFEKRESSFADSVPVGLLGITSETPFLNSSKYKDIEKWISKIQSYFNASCTDTDLQVNIKRSEKETLNSSAEKILDKLYGSIWRADSRPMHSELVRTEPYRKKHLKCVSALRPHTECKRQAPIKNRPSSSCDSEDFEEFLKNVRPDFESTHQKVQFSVLEGADVTINNDNSSEAVSQENDKIYLKRDNLHCKGNLDVSSDPKNTDVIKQLTYSSSDISAECNGDEGPTIKTKTDKKKGNNSVKNKKVQRTQKVIVSPVRRNLVRKTPKTANCAKTKSCFVDEAGKFCTPVLTFLSSLSGGVANGRRHPEAEFFVNNFKKKKEELCSKLFTLYNNKIFDDKLPADMLLQWNVRMKRTAGFCYNQRTLVSPGTKIRTSRLALSSKVCDTADRLRDTLIHEMCHAATWIVDGVKDGHGPKWKAWARKAMRIFPELPPIRRCHDYKIQTKFTYRCKSCGYSIGRHSKSLDTATKRCGHCYGEFELLVNTRRKSGTVMQETPKKRSPVGFARFVKDNYNFVKLSKTGLKHGDVMRLLGQQFSAVKIGSVPVK